ncbi:uncharacterized protein LOC115547243 isoform X1 [Gadus morhua]|uniref:uncharacterized protein LOC115547243 isoform X1 n=1 Tax=Gadus morhua TaxID=8049 RepID=UPI0011B65E70|nr:uncharacterized protein LOC115547243 isoform X1 [Gadus morhua]
MDLSLGRRKVFLFLSALLTAVGVFGDPCKVTHQGKATTYNILNPVSNADWEYSWADSNGTVLATDGDPNNGNISSSDSFLTLPGCLKKVCVTIDCHPKHHTTCCPTDCPAAPEPQEHIDPTTSSPALAVVWTPEGIAGTVVGTVVVIVVVIALVIAVVIAVVIAFEKKRKKKGWLERIKGACSSNEPQSGRGADGRPEVIAMLDV